MECLTIKLLVSNWYLASGNINKNQIFFFVLETQCQLLYHILNTLEKRIFAKKEQIRESILDTKQKKKEMDKDWKETAKKVKYFSVFSLQC